MYVYKITFLGGATTKIRANSPKEASERAEWVFQMEVIHIKTVR